MIALFMYTIVHWLLINNFSATSVIEEFRLSWCHRLRESSNQSRTSQRLASEVDCIFIPNDKNNFTLYNAEPCYSYHHVEFNVSSV